MDFDYLACKLFIAVRFLGVRPVLAKLRQKDPSKNVDFLQKSEDAFLAPKKAVFWPKQQK